MATKIILAIDFDGTIADASWPTLGGIKPGAQKFINKLWEEGYYIIINTCRSGEHTDWVKDWLKKHFIMHHRINENHPQLIERFADDCRKIAADIYIDDKGLGCSSLGFPQWSSVYRLVKNDSLYLRHKLLDI